MPLFRTLPLVSLLFTTASPGQEPSLAADATAGMIDLAPVVVTGKAQDLLGVAPSASKGQADAEELAQRPFLRRGELLEVVPGMVVTQHSGGGKANQYFVRGYNLDHGTDFAVFVDQMPVNNRSHGHGQGYADINFIIPELVEELEYVKGPYFAQFGDFSTAGAARFHLFRKLPEGIVSLGWGTDQYYRGLVADSIDAGPGALTFALEYQSYDGPWEHPDNLQRWNGLLRYSAGDDDNWLNVTLMGSDGRWDASDQIPQRLIDSGEVGRFGLVDPTLGGSTYRYSLSSDVQWTTESGVTQASAYVGTYQLDLFSNFTLFLNDPVNGDQFNQFDDRWFAGGTVTHQFSEAEFFGRMTNLEVGLQTHHDWIDGVGLHQTRARERLSTVREDDVYEASLGAYGISEVFWNSWLRSQVGLRADLFYFDVDSRTLAANSGSDWDAIVSPKLGFVFGPWRQTEFYLNGGLGFHSNDARGVTITVDPETGEGVDPVDPLVQTAGAEFGLRTQIVPGLTSTLSLWYLHSDSELVYVGDAGTIEAGDASERYGVEWVNYWRPNDWLYVDTELALTDSRFTTTGEEIENMVPVSFSGGVAVGRQEGLFASLRARYFSQRPLTGDGSVESKDAFQLNGRIGYRKRGWEVAVEVLNLLDAKDNDIEYFYTSRVPGESLAGIDDRHIHPVEPRQIRLVVTKRW